MNFLINAQISRKFKVSAPTVIRWISGALEQRNSLQVQTINRKVRVLDNNHNDIELKRLSIEGQKFKSSQANKTVQVADDFYKLFSEEEQVEIWNDLEFRKDVNLKFMYKGLGAYLWDDAYNNMQQHIKAEAELLLNNNYKTVEFFIRNQKKINLIDIGPGNAFPTKPIIELLGDKLHKYIPIDISEEMLDITKSNLRSEFPRLEINSYTADVERNRLDKIFLENKNFDQETVNLVLMTGNTLCNQTARDLILNNIKSSLQPKDIFIYTVSLNSYENRTAFRYVKYNEDEVKYAWLFTVLGFDIDKCEVVLNWDENQKRKIKTYKLDKDYTLKFKLLGQDKEIKFHKDDEIVRWQHYLLDLDLIEKELAEVGLDVLSYHTDLTQSNAVIICKTK